MLWVQRLGATNWFHYQLTSFTQLKILAAEGEEGATGSRSAIDDVRRMYIRN